MTKILDNRHVLTVLVCIITAKLGYKFSKPPRNRRGGVSPPVSEKLGFYSFPITSHMTR